MLAHTFNINRDCGTDPCMTSEIFFSFVFFSSTTTSGTPMTSSGTTSAPASSMEEAFGRLSMNTPGTVRSPSLTCRIRTCRDGYSQKSKTKDWIIFQGCFWWTLMAETVFCNVFPAGSITMEDLIAVLPFGGTFDLVELKGSTLRKAFEHSVKRYGESTGEFLQVSGICPFTSTLVIQCTVGYS